MTNKFNQILEINLQLTLAMLRLETPDFTWPIRGLTKSGVSRRNIAKVSCKLISSIWLNLFVIILQITNFNFKVPFLFQ